MTLSCKKIIIILAIAVIGRGKASQEASSIFQLRGWTGRSLPSEEAWFISEAQTMKTTAIGLVAFSPRNNFLL